MEISTVKPNNLTPVFTAPKRSDVVRNIQQNEAKSAEKDPLTAKQQVKDVPDSEKPRLETVIKGAKLLSNVYAVSDTTFSIFKDKDGQYITRFTNLRDGSVTYFPEPEVLQFMERHSAARAATIEVEA